MIRGEPGSSIQYEDPSKLGAFTPLGESLNAGIEHSILARAVEVHRRTLSRALSSAP